jgi:plasmid stabilization system protein ParE
MKLRYKKRALADIEAIHKYITDYDRQAANGVVRRIERSIERLLVLPLSGRLGPVPGTRLLVVPGLPYIVLHRVGDETIDIVAVLHTARRRRS